MGKKFMSTASMSRYTLGAYLLLCILKIDGKQNSGGKELVEHCNLCHLGLLHDFSRFLNLIIITTQ